MKQQRRMLFACHGRAGAPLYALAWCARVRCMTRWVHAEKVSVKRCQFQGHALRLLPHENAADAKALVAQLVSDRNLRLFKCTHNIYAFKQSESLRGFSDDGEKSAGGRLLSILDAGGPDLFGTLLVVSRWYGGRHLGSQRFRAIASSGQQALALLPPQK